MQPFLEAIAQGRILLFDGAMGTQLAARGAVEGPISNLQFPDEVKAIHADYRRAGSEIILTNTLTANRIALEHAGLADRLEELNAEGVRLCREAAGDECYVAGDMSSTGQFMQPLGDYTEQQFYDNAAEQASILAENGVDCIIVETMTHVAEACIVAKAAKAATGLPVIATIAFDPAGGQFRTMMGDSIEDAVRGLTDAGADVIGANCGTLDPVELSQVINRMRALSSIALAAQPNAGKPELAAGRTVFKLAPDEFADGVLKCADAGATLLGGCCGTTPAHIAALARRVHSLN